MSVCLADNCLAAAVMKWVEASGDLDKLPAEVKEATGWVVIRYLSQSSCAASAMLGGAQPGAAL